MDDVQDQTLETPFGSPSDSIHVGLIDGTRVAFLARHGRNHHLLPSEINFRANIWALKKLGVERIISASAVGSLSEDIAPRDVVTCDQFIDRTHLRPSTFFGRGIVGHVGLGDPICETVRERLAASVIGLGGRCHDRGTYVCMEGPAFSTRAESELYRSWGAQVIGMTNLQEARLAREAEICYGTMALVTDYDCWHEEEEDVSVGALLENLKANSTLAAAVVRDVVGQFAEMPRDCGCKDALRGAILTPFDKVPRETLDDLAPILSKYGPK
jgi:5'-methylthioadenosine phosphorylase